MKYRILKIGDYFMVQYRFCFIWLNLENINRNKSFDIVYNALTKHQKNQRKESLWEKIKTASICENTASEK